MEIASIDRMRGTRIPTTNASVPCAVEHGSDSCHGRPWSSRCGPLRRIDPCAECNHCAVDRRRRRTQQEFQIVMLPESIDGASEERRRRERTRAHGASRGNIERGRESPDRGETTPASASVHDVSPLPGLTRLLPEFPRLAPWALVLSRLRRSSEAPSIDSGNITI